MGGEEVSMATVTEMGFPVNLRIQAPWLLRAQGSAQVHRNFSAQANVTCLYSAGLSAQLSVQPSWASREYVAAVNGHAMVQIPATAVHAEMSGPSGRFSVRVQPSQPQQASVVARVALQPLTASVEVSRGELASESATAHNASMGAGQGDSVLMSLWDNVSLNLRAPVERNALPAWIRDSRTVLGFPALGRPLSASRLEVVASRAHSFNVSVALVKGMLQSGDFQVVYPDDMRQDNDEHASPAGPTSTTTETPVRSSTTEMPTTTEAATTTVTPAVVRSPRWADHSRRFHGNGSMFVDNGDMDFTRSVFNATTLNPYTNRINGSSELYVLSQVLAGMSAGRGYVVGVNVTSEDISGGSQAPAHYSGFWTVGANLGGRLMRAGLFARSDADNAQVAATAAVLRDVAARSSIDAALHQQPALMIKAEYQQVDAKAVRKIVTAAMETDHSAAKTQRLWRAAKEQFCVKPDHAMQSGSMQNASVSPACRSILGSANIPDQFNLTINYNNPAEEAWGSSVHLALEAAKAYLWNQGNIAVDTIAPGNGNELGAGITVQAGGKLDGWLQTPRTLTKVASASAPVASTLLAAANQETRAFCGATSSQLVTLDGVQGSIKMGACWHVLAKDCSGKSRVAVLARSDKAQPDDIHVEINIDNYQIARLSPDGAATLNGVAVADHSNQTGSAVQVRDAADVQVMTIVRSEDGALIIKLPDHDMSVVYGNSSVVIQAGSSLHGRLCGVCGKFDGSFSGEMLNPKNKAEKSIQALVDSYAIKDAQCGANGKSRQ
ncbi:hypothetical protein FOCC_FOCC004152 [Frankliniella occidentalis]|uniref:Uncharacterized protein LOC113212925 n=1 Tax=Frankliniella occidentalis TaxID=133901 RepID=A0A9C6TSE1_FRAOC|nr:uncharacterized protein LOC113212925 [Frankliniella occidentalis]KAE8748985.1 hypothetical protein FOCC_FOCC004152 [Frankliniella occidentalis]